MYHQTLFSTIRAVKHRNRSSGGGNHFFSTLSPDLWTSCVFCLVVVRVSGGPDPWTPHSLSPRSATYRELDTVDTVRFSWVEMSDVIAQRSACSNPNPQPLTPNPNPNLTQLHRILTRSTTQVDVLSMRPSALRYSNLFYNAKATNEGE